MQRKETPSLSSSSRHLGAVLRPRISKVTAPKHFLLDDHKPLRFSKTPNLNFVNSFDDVRNTTRFSSTQRVLETSPDMNTLYSPLTRTQTFGRKSLFNRNFTSPDIGPHLDHRRYEADPRLKSWGSAISKKVGDTDVPDEESDASPYYDLKIPAVSCKDCQIVRKKRLSSHHKGVEKMEFLYCSKHLAQFQVQRKYLSISAESDMLNDKEKEFTKPENRQRFESFRRTLFTDEPQPHLLQDYKITPMKTSFGGGNESDKLETILQQLNALKMSLQGNYSNLEGLFIKQIKKFLLDNLGLYTDLRQKIKIELEEETPRLGSQFSSSKRNARNWDEIDFKTFALKKDCEDLLKVIDQRPWEVLNLGGDFEKLLVELQGNQGSFADSTSSSKDRSNRSNVRRVLELSKDVQNMKQQESELKKELEEAKAKINKLEAEALVQGSFDKLNKQRLEELGKELESKNMTNGYLEKEARDLKAKLLDPKTLIKEHLELTVRELAVLLSNGEAKDLSEEAKNLLQKALVPSQENNEKMSEIIKKLFEQNQDLNGELELQQAENAALGTQVYQRKQREEMLLKEARSRGSAGRNTSRKEGGAFLRSFESSFSNIPDTHSEMTAIKARMMEHVDYLMITHMQSLALEDHVYKNESLNKILEYTISSQQKKEEENNHVVPPKIVKKFSFFDQ